MTGIGKIITGLSSYDDVATKSLVWKGGIFLWKRGTFESPI